MRFVKTVLLRLLAVAAFGAGVLALRSALDPEQFRRMVSLLSIPVMGVSVLMVLRTYRRERAFTRWVQILTLVTPLATLAVHLFLYGGGTQGWRTATIVAGLVGLVLGGQRSAATNLYLKEGRVFGRNSGWWLLLWAVSFMVTQGMVLWGRRTGLNVSIVVLAFGSGTAAGASLELLKGIGRTLTRGAAATAALVVALLGAGAAPAEEFLFEESFDHRLDLSKWSLPRTDGQTPGRWRVRGGSLEIRKLPGTRDGIDLFSARQVAFAGKAADFTAEMLIQDIRVKDNMITGRRDLLTGKAIPPYPSEGKARIALWMIPKTGSMITGAFGIGVYASHFKDPKKDRHPYAVEVTYYVQGRDDWEHRRHFFDLPEGKSPLRLRIEKRGSNHRFYADGALLHETTDAVLTVPGWMPAIHAGSDGGPSITAKIDYVTFVGELLGAAPPGTAGRRHLDRPGDQDIPEEARDAAGAAGLLGSLGALLLLLSSLGQGAGAAASAATAAPAPAPTRKPPALPEAPTGPTPEELAARAEGMERDLAAIEARGKACWDRVAPLRQVGEQQMTALDDRLDGLVAEAEDVEEGRQKLWQHIVDLEEELESAGERFDKAVKLASRSREDDLAEVRGKYDQVGAIVDPDRVEEAIRQGDDAALGSLRKPAGLETQREVVEKFDIPRLRERIAALRNAPHEVFDPPQRGLFGRVIARDSKEWLEHNEGILAGHMRKKEQLDTLLEGGFRSVFDRVAERSREIVNLEKDRDRELGRIRRELETAKAGYDDLEARGKNLAVAERAAGKALDEIRKPFPELDRMGELRERHAKAIRDYRQLAAQVDPGAPAFARQASRLLNEARRAATELCEASQRAGDAIRPAEPAADPGEPPPPAEPYVGYQDDLAYLDGQRDAVHHQQQSLNSYLRNHPPGSPHHDGKVVDDMRARLRDFRRTLRDQEARIRASGGQVPPDLGPDHFSDPYAGVGAEAGLSWKRLLDERQWQEHLSGKMSEFMDRHPEYRRLRDNLYNPDGSVNVEKLGKLRVHHMGEAFFSGTTPIDELTSTGYWMKNGAYLSARQLFTGVKADGTTSWGSLGASMFVRAGAAVKTGGLSEYVGMPVDFLFRLKDGFDQDKTAFGALRDSLNMTLFDHFAGEALSAGLSKGMGKLTETFPGLTNSLREASEGLANRLNKPLWGGAPLDLPPQLTLKKAKLLGALDSGSDEAILGLYKNGGMKELGALEAMGHIDDGMADELNRVLRENGQSSILSGTKTTVDEFGEQTGVRVKKLTMGDSGSSSIRGTKQSVLTDFDRTLVVDFNESDLAEYARKGGIDPDTARQQLGEKFKVMHEEAVDASLRSKGLTNDDIGYASYNGIGAGAGHADAYSKAYTYFRQWKGSGLEFKIGEDGRMLLNADGGAACYKTGGQAVIDANELVTGKYSGHYDADPMRYTWSDWESVIGQQKMAAAHYTDVKHLAKALDRASEAATKMGAGMGDPVIEGIATQIRKNPQDALGILNRNGLTKSTFVNRAKGIIANYTTPRAT